MIYQEKLILGTVASELSSTILTPNGKESMVDFLHLSESLLTQERSICVVGADTAFEHINHFLSQAKITISNTLLD